MDNMDKRDEFKEKLEKFIKNIIDHGHLMSELNIQHQI